MVPSLYLCHQSVRTGTEFLGLPGYDLFTGFNQCTGVEADLRIPTEETSQGNLQSNNSLVQRDGKFNFPFPSHICMTQRQEGMAGSCCAHSDRNTEEIHCSSGMNHQTACCHRKLMTDLKVDSELRLNILGFCMFYPPKSGHIITGNSVIHFTSVEKPLRYPHSCYRQ